MNLKRPLLVLGLAALGGVAAPLVSQAGGQTVHAIWDPSTPRQFELISRYRDNPDFVVERRNAPQFAPIGELETIEPEKDGSHFYATAFIISPCYAMTAKHAIFYGPENDPVPGKDYSQLLRVGIAEVPGVKFLGNTRATPIIWGSSIAHNGDWALLKLKTCVGARPDIGWMEFSTQPMSKLVSATITVAGFSGVNERGVLSFSVGRVVRDSPWAGAFIHSASASGGQSGGPVMVRENGAIRVIGVHNIEHFPKEQKPAPKLYDTLIYPDNFNEFVAMQAMFLNFNGGGMEITAAKWQEMQTLAKNVVQRYPNEDAFSLSVAIADRKRGLGWIPAIIALDRARVGANPAEAYMTADWPKPVVGIPKPY